MLLLLQLLQLLILPIDLPQVISHVTEKIPIVSLCRISQINEFTVDVLLHLLAVLNRNLRRPNGTGNGTGAMHHMNNTAAAAAAAAAAGKQVNKVKPTVNVSRQVEGQVISPSQYNRWVLFKGHTGSVYIYATGVEHGALSITIDINHIKRHSVELRIAKQSR